MDRPSWLACWRGSCVTGGSPPLSLAEGARERLLWWLAEAGGVLRVTALRVYSIESYSIEELTVLRSYNIIDLQY